MKSLRLLTVLCFAVFALLPGVAMWQYRLDPLWLLPISIAHYTVVLTVWLWLISYLPKWRYIVATLAALYYTFLYVLMLHIVYVGFTFDAYLFWDSYKDVLTTGVGIFGLPVIVLMFCGLGCVVLLALALSTLALPLQKHLYRNKLSVVLPIIGICFIVAAGSRYGLLIASVRQTIEGVEMRSITTNEYQNILLEELGKSTSENVIILQLESLNGLAANGYIPGYEGVYIPEFIHAAQQGTYFPLVWSNGIQTNRAQTSILCGMAGNMRKSYSYRPNDIKQQCLPDLLREHGYNTIAYRSDDLEFARTGDFLRSLGFDKVVHDEILQPEDQYYEWGYDDCTFYKRVVDDLSTQGDQPFFAYIEVSSNHFPFPEKTEYKDFFPFKEPKNFTERYLNSLAYQDYCMGQFVQRWQQVDPGNTHIMITSDTSSPVGLQRGNTLVVRGSHTENFLTSMAYLPPKNTQNSYNRNVVATMSTSHTDIYPTVVDLLFDSTMQNSFAPAVKRVPASSYEECHVLMQPYFDPAISIVRGPDKYTYYFEGGHVQHTNIVTAPLEQSTEVINKHISATAFLEDFYCDRFIASPTKPSTPMQLAVPHSTGAIAQRFLPKLKHSTESLMGNPNVSIDLSRPLMASIVIGLLFCVYMGILETGVRRIKLPKRTIRISTFSQTAVQLVSFVCVVVIICYGLLGPTEEAGALLSLLIWKYAIIMVPLIVLCIGNVWPVLHPSAFIGHLINTLQKPVPDSISKWCAPILLIGVFWIQYVFAHAYDAQALALFVTAYMFLSLLGMQLWGVKQWLTKCDPFCVLYNAILQIGSLTSVSLDSKKDAQIHRHISMVAIYIAGVLTGPFFASHFWFTQYIALRDIGIPHKVVLTTGLGLVMLGSYIAYNFIHVCSSMLGGMKWNSTILSPLVTKSFTWGLVSLLLTYGVHILVPMPIFWHMVVLLLCGIASLWSAAVALTDQNYPMRILSINYVVVVCTTLICFALVA